MECNLLVVAPDGTAGLVIVFGVERPVSPEVDFNLLEELA